MPTLDARPGRLDVVLRPGNTTTLELTWPNDLAARSFDAEVDGAPLEVSVDGDVITVVFDNVTTAALSGRPTWTMTETTGGDDQVIVAGRVLLSYGGTSGQDVSATVTVNDVSVTIDVIAGEMDQAAVQALITTYAQPVDPDLTLLAGTTSTAFGRSLLTPADAAAARALLDAQQTGDFVTTAELAAAALGDTDPLGLVTQEELAEVVDATVRLANVPIYLAERGVSHLATAAANTAAAQAAIIEAEVSGRTIVWPQVPLGSWIDINDRLLVETGGITIDGAWTRVRQTVFPKPIIEVLGPDVDIHSFHMGSTAWNATLFHGSFRAATQQVYHTGIYAAADRVKVRDLTIDGMYTGVWFASYDVDLGALRTWLLDCECHNITVDNVVFGLLWGDVSGFKFSNINGSYRLMPGASTPPHLLYSSASVAKNIGVVGSDCYAYDGADSRAFQIKEDDGGQFTNLNARDCLGVLNVMNCENTRFSQVVSIGDLHTGAVDASIELQDPNDNIKIADFLVHMAANGKPVRLGSLTTNSTVRDGDVISNHTTVEANADDVELDGTSNTADRVWVRNVGASAWAGSVSAWAGTGNRIIAPRTSGNSVGVRVRSSATNARVLNYNPADVTGTARSLDIGNSTASLRPIPNHAVSIDANRVLVYDMGDRRPGTSISSGTSSGHAWVQAVGSWQTDANGRIFKSSSASSGVAYVDAGVADCEVSVGIKYQDREGLRLRYVDQNNNLQVILRHTTGLLEVASNVAGVATAFTAAFVPVVGRRYRLTARIYGNQAEYLVDGKSILTHTIPADGMAAYGTNTRHGLFSPVASDPNALFDNFEIRSLT